MSFHRIHVPIVFNYTSYDILVAYIDNMANDLGIAFYWELTFYDHIEKSYWKALKSLDFIKRVSSGFNLIATLKALYCALIKSILV